jgi:hypothetical protein
LVGQKQDQEAFVEFDQAGIIQEQLSGGERLLWSGKPSSGVRLRAADILFIPFSVLWAGFAFFWEFTAVTQGAPLFMRLWGVPFVVLGLYILVGRFFYEAYRRGNTYYGVTSRRVLIVRTGIGGSLTSLNLRTLPDVKLTGGRSSRLRSIEFSSAARPFGSWFASSGWPGTQMAPTFELLDNAQEAHDIVLQAQGSCR